MCSLLSIALSKKIVAIHKAMASHAIQNQYDIQLSMSGELRPSESTDSELSVKQVRQRSRQVASVSQSTFICSQYHSGNTPMMRSRSSIASAEGTEALAYIQVSTIQILFVLR